MPEAENNASPVKRFQYMIWGDFYRGKTQLRTNFIATHILGFSLCSIEEHNKCDFLAIFSRPDLTRFHL